MKFFFTPLIMLTALTGCIGMTCMSPSCLGEETYNNLIHAQPYGAHWVKEGMTHESRRTDFAQCGGSDDLRDGYAEWLSSIRYETYSTSRALHIQSISACMKSKNYDWLTDCDKRCSYP